MNVSIIEPGSEKGYLVPISEYGHPIFTLPYQVELARHSMTRFLHSSLFPITVFSSSVVHPLSSLSCAVYVLFGRPGFRCPCKGSHRSTSLIISSLLRQQCLEKRILCSLIVIVIFGIFPYNSLLYV